MEKQTVIISPCYAPFSDVFCPKRATQLFPIDLIPGEPVPHGKIYPLSIPEQKAMEEYIEEALQQDYIRPSKSPAAFSFIFISVSLSWFISLHSVSNLRVFVSQPQTNELTHWEACDVGKIWTSAA